MIKYTYMIPILHNIDVEAPDDEEEEDSIEGDLKAWKQMFPELQKIHSIYVVTSSIFPTFTIIMGTIVLYNVYLHH